MSWLDWLHLRPRRKQEPVGKEFVTWVEFGKCPTCGSTDQWIEGPSGGMCTNFTCNTCGNKYNIAPPPLSLIQRIGSRSASDEP